MDEPVTMDKAALEAFANTFDLTFHPQKPDIAAAEAREDARYQEYLRQTEAAQKANEEFYGKGSYAERIRYNIEEEYRSDRYGYVLMDLDGNGVAELLIGQDGWFKHLYTVSGETTTALIDANIFIYATLVRISLWRITTNICKKCRTRLGAAFPFASPAARQPKFFPRNTPCPIVCHSISGVSIPVFRFRSAPFVNFHMENQKSDTRICLSVN